MQYPIAGEPSCSEHLNSSREGSAASRGSCGRTLSQSSHDVCRTNSSRAIPTIPRSVRRSLRVCLRSRDSALRGPHLFATSSCRYVSHRAVWFEIWEKALVLSLQHRAMDANIRRISCSACVISRSSQSNTKYRRQLRRCTACRLVGRSWGRY